MNNDNIPVTPEEDEAFEQIEPMANWETPAQHLRDGLNGTGTSMAGQDLK